MRFQFCLKWVLGLAGCWLLPSMAQMGTPNTPPTCMHYTAVCDGPRQCLRWVQERSLACYICGRYFVRGGYSQPIARMETCSPKWVVRMRARGWRCAPQVNPEGVDSGHDHCVVWHQTHCRWICTVR